MYRDGSRLVTETLCHLRGLIESRSFDEWVEEVLEQNGTSVNIKQQFFCVKQKQNCMDYHD